MRRQAVTGAQFTRLLYAIRLPLVAAVTIAALPSMKWAVVGFAWATGVTR